MPWLIFALAAAGIWWYETRNTDSSIGGHPVQVVGNPPGPVGNPPIGPSGIMVPNLPGTPPGSVDHPAGFGGGGMMPAVMGDDSKIPKKGNIGGGGPGNAGAIARNRIQQKLPQTQPSWWSESLQEDIRYVATPNMAGIPANNWRKLGDNHGGRS